MRRGKYFNINHAYPITVLPDTHYVKKINDSPDRAIYITFSHFAAFFIVAVTKRFNVNRFNLYVRAVIELLMNNRKKNDIMEAIFRIQ